MTKEELLALRTKYLQMLDKINSWYAGARWAVEIYKKYLANWNDPTAYYSTGLNVFFLDNGLLGEITTFWVTPNQATGAYGRQAEQAVARYDGYVATANAEIAFLDAKIAVAESEEKASSATSPIAEASQAVLVNSNSPENVPLVSGITTEKAQTTSDGSLSKVSVGAFAPMPQSVSPTPPQGVADTQTSGSAGVGDITSVAGATPSNKGVFVMVGLLLAGIAGLMMFRRKA